MAARTRQHQQGLSAVGRVLVTLTWIVVNGCWPVNAAQSPHGRGPAPAATAVDPIVFESARTAFEALPEEERHAFQEALVWASEFNTVTSGSFGRRTFDAIVLYQKRHGLPPNGILDPAAQTALVGEASKLRQSVDFSIQVDSRSGLRIGLPLKLITQKTSTTNGTKWQSATGSLSLETVVLDAHDRTLLALFNELAATKPPRKITYQFMRPDWFVLSGEAADRKFYIRYAQGTANGKSELRGFTWTYVAGVPLAGPLATAIANSFDPFPDNTVSPAAQKALSETAQAAVPVPMPPVLRATATVVAPGRLLTALAPPGCSVLTVGSRPAQLLLSDSESGLALLQVDDLPNAALTSALAQFAAPAEGLVVGYLSLPTEQLAVIPAAAVISKSRGVSVQAGLQVGAGGSLLFDRAGRVRAVVAPPHDLPRAVAGLLPQAEWRVIEAAGIAAFLERAGIRRDIAAADEQLPKTLTAAEIAQTVHDSLLSVHCQP
jgi:hypothetical protein